MAAVERGLAVLDQLIPPGKAESNLPADEPAWPTALDLAALATLEPQPPQHIIPNWLPAGEVTLFAGHGGSGKSAIALHLGAAVALGRPWHGIEVGRRPVTYISAEDPAAVLHWRLSRIAGHFGVQLSDFADRLHIIDASQLSAELMIETRDEPVLTALYDALQQRRLPGHVLILDGASDLYGASEITRRHVRKFVRALRALVPPDGAALLLAHIDKAAARNGGGDHYSGSTAWNNSVRARWALRSEDSGLKLCLEKANHAPAGAEIRLRWDPQAHLHLADGAAAEGGIVASIRERQERDGILAAIRACTAAGMVVPAALQGARTAHSVLMARKELPQSLRGGRDAARRFRSILESLRQSGEVLEQTIRRPHRHPVTALVAKDGCASA